MGARRGPGPLARFCADCEPMAYKRANSTKPGFVYAIETWPGLVKVGFTANIEKRLAAYHTHCGKFNVLRVEPGTKADERLLHGAFKPYRMDGTMEHFYNVMDVTAWIAGNVSTADLRG